MADEKLEAAFLEELEALDKFRLSYSAQHTSVPLAHDDPDVRRMIEAMAFFTARTHLAAMRSLDASVLRIFRQHFPFLVGPVPAMAMLTAAPTSKFSEVTELPRGVEVLVRKPVRTERGEPERIFRFRTTSRLRILPIRIDSVERYVLPSDDLRYVVRIAANTAHNVELGDLRLHVNHVDDLRSSIMLHHALRTQVERVTVHYGPNPRLDLDGEPCDVTFGPLPEEPEPDAFEQPLQRARLEMRFPQQGLFLHVGGLTPPRNWQHVTLCLDMKKSWPRQLHFTSDSLVLHTVPMINVRRDLASPIECDGTRDSYAVKHPDATARYALLWAVGAYKPSPDGFVPLAPGLFGDEGDSYEIVTDGAGEDRRARAMLRIQGAYRKPQMVAVDAFWHQPGLRSADLVEREVLLADRHVDAVKWSCPGRIVQSVEGTLDSLRDRQLQLISMKSKRALDKRDLTALLEACGARGEEHYAKIIDAITDVGVEARPSGQRENEEKQVYRISFSRVDSMDIPNLLSYGQWLLALLRTWCASRILEVVLQVPSLDAPVRCA